MNDKLEACSWCLIAFDAINTLATTKLASYY